MKTSLAIAIAALLVSSAAAAQSGTQASVSPGNSAPVTSPSTADVVDPDKKRCKRMAVTGSRTGKSVCHTEREWAAMEKNAQEFMRDLEGQPRRDPSYDNGGGGRPVGQPVGGGG